MANEKDKKDGEEMQKVRCADFGEEIQKVRCADFAVSYYVKFEPVDDHTAFRTGKMKLAPRPDETSLYFETMILSNPGMTALRIAEEIEKELANLGYPRGYVCVLNFWLIGYNYWEDVTSYTINETEDLPK